MNQHLERLEGLAPLIQRPARELLARCQAQLKRTLFVVHGWRSLQEQALLYQQGRIYVRESGTWEVHDARKVVTHAKPGSTPHNVIARTGEAASLAMDVIPLLENGQPDWHTPMSFWDELYAIAWDVGLDPLGDKIGAYLSGDLGHFEEPAWKLKLDALGLMLPSETTAAGV